jgi:hypothetical protein
VRILLLLPLHLLLDSSLKLGITCAKKMHEKFLIM